MVFERLKVARLKRLVEKEESLKKERSRKLKEKFAKEINLKKEEADLLLEEQRLKDRLKKARQFGLTKEQKAFYAKREKHIAAKKKELKDKFKNLGKETVSILATFARGLDRTIQEQHKVKKSKPKKKAPKKKKTAKKTKKK